jgi:hypothetical protein
VKDVRASVGIAPAVVVAVAAVAFAGCLGACTSGSTPDCDGGVCGYGNPDTGPEEAGEAGLPTEPTDTGSPSDDAPVDAMGQ